MRSKSILLAFLGTTFAAQTWPRPAANVSNYTLGDAQYEWTAPSLSDRRSPCPMVNTLANHGYLARDGVNVSMADLIVAFNASVNLAPSATQLVGALALTASTTGNASTFNLDDINRHGIIEHDGSLSRNDAYFGDAHTFNASIWSSVAAYFTESTISIETAAKARSARIEVAAAVNPNFNMTTKDIQHSIIESALYLSVFGDIMTGNAVTKWVGVMFSEERLPYAEGFTRPAEQLTVTSILTMMNTLAELSA